MLSCCLAWFIQISAAGSATELKSQRPNILFLMTDQHRWDGIGANGNALIKTPNFDRLAADGANFTHAFVVAPVCVPSRISFFTGRYPHSHRNRVNYTPLDRSEILLQARLRDAGYSTAAIGKLHYSPPSKEEAYRTGFEFAELHDGNPKTDPWSDYVKWRKERDPNKNLGYRAIARDIKPGKNPYRSAIAAEFSETGWVGERTRLKIRELANEKKPFFLHASFWKPHAPFDVCEPYDRMYDDIQFPIPDAAAAWAEIPQRPVPLQKLAQRDGRNDEQYTPERLQWIYRSYFGTISHVDAEVGEILKTLEELGIRDNTIIVFSSDHGDDLFEHAIMGKNCFFESAVRVPLMVSWPGQVNSKHHDELIESVDVLPTLFELIGLPEPRSCQGKSFAPLIANLGRSYAPHEVIFSENIIPEVITGGKLFLSFEKGGGVDGVRHPDAKMARTKRWKFNYYPEGYQELFDLETDPGEHVNLAASPEHQATVMAMKDRLLRWLVTADEADQIAPRWLIYEPQEQPIP